MRPHGKYAVVNPNNPEAFAQCDRCGFWYNRSALVWQTQWAGQHIYSTGALVCEDRCFDTPNEQLRTIILPPDPPPIINARPPNLVYEEDGPTQTTLSASVLAGATSLPVVSAAGFEIGNLVWVQLNNANYAQMLVVGVNTTSNVISINSPLPYSAPYTGSVTVSDTEPLTTLNAQQSGQGALSAAPIAVFVGLGRFGGAGGVSVRARLGLTAFASCIGSGALSVRGRAGLAARGTVAGAGGLSVSATIV